LSIRTLVALSLVFVCSLSSLGLASAEEEERFEPSSRGTRSERPVEGPSERAIGGVATWYGADFQGSPMANGVPYDMWDPTTAASNIFPLGTRLRVTRVETGQSVVVRVTDRGAFRAPILVDLSYAAFSTLAHEDVGVISVTVEPID
jgi:rare lipoprotein A (peptidoglycan hydrolase)